MNWNPSRPATPVRDAPLEAGVPLWDQLARRVPDVARRLRAARCPAALPHAAIAAQCILPIAAVEALCEGIDPLPLTPALTQASAPRRLAFIAGRLCAEMAFIDVLGVPLGVARAHSGEPLWPAAWCGSIAHSGEWACAALALRASPGGGGIASVGLDVERIVDDAGRRSIEAVCLVAPECAFVARSGRPHACATAVFSAKEAYYKAVYPTLRRFVDFDEVVVDVGAVDAASWVGHFTVRAARRSSRDLPTLAGRWSALPGHVVSVVAWPDARSPQRARTAVRSTKVAQ